MRKFRMKIESPRIQVQLLTSYKSRSGSHPDASGKLGYLQVSSVQMQDEITAKRISSCLKRLVFLVRFMEACWEQARLWLSSPLHSCNAVFYCRHRNTPYQQRMYVCAGSEWAIWLNICEAGNAYGFHQYPRCVWVCVLVRVEMFKPISDHTLCVRRRQEVGSIASRCWRRSRNSPNIPSPSSPAPTPKP